MKTAFKFQRQWAALLPGSSEGIYGFIAANYASGALLEPIPDAESLLGVVELGGASLQVSHFCKASQTTSNNRLWDSIQKMNLPTQNGLS